ncbi:MAG: TIGR03790 family protein [Proteobacteria bacterium]|nr:TIGR03790 family protein [Desulfobacula sp.]MBU3953478.1 TIGR03790 family protein [Pseudomonadota bacterium]MBU4132435.1 TIGR03790 family protein [Pseudomonadota bacterium]
MRPLPARIMILCLVCLFFPQVTHALAPEEVLVIANRNAAKSIGLAKYYMEQRRIPLQNLVLVWMTDKETCTRQEYETKAVPPIRRFLEKNPQIRAMVTLLGVPLKINGADNLDGEIKETTRQTDSGASFDSELSLVKLGPYELNGWQPNPFYLGFKDQPPKISKTLVMMTSRLDAASAKIVRRIIDDSISAEKEGIQGTGYFDARWKDTQEKNSSGYAFYDQSLHRTARFHSKKKILPVVLNDTQDLFRPGDCPNAALYCGWYSLGHYIDAFQWVKGSVGYHIASSEASTLKDKNSQAWCKRMLDKGIAATIGPVGEPYIQAFPVPEIFFNFLTEGYLTLAESYMVSLPFLSWKMVLIGDPLYRMNIRGHKK